MVYVNRNGLVALATIELVDHEAFRGSQDLKRLPWLWCLSRIFWVSPSTFDAYAEAIYREHNPTKLSEVEAR